MNGSNPERSSKGNPPNSEKKELRVNNRIKNHFIMSKVIDLSITGEGLQSEHPVDPIRTLQDVNRLFREGPRGKLLRKHRTH